MAQNYKTATVFGGSGFVGRQIIHELVARDIAVKVVTRASDNELLAELGGETGQVVPVKCDYSDDANITAAAEGSDIVINCIGVLFERGSQTFQKAHVDIPNAIAKASSKAGVERFVHICALAVERGTSQYAKSKAAGEKAVFSAFPKASILRPSIIFGEDDSFFNMFASMAKVLPAFPLIGGGKPLFQPVFVGDVADAVIAALMDDKVQGQIYELAGPETLSFKEVYETMFGYTGQKRFLIPIPFNAAKVQAFFMGMLPKPLLTGDQVESLKTDNVMNDGALGLSDLGVAPTALDSILPTYLSRYRRAG